MFVATPNPYVEALIPNVMVFGGGAFATLYDPIDGSPLGSPISGILQARTLEWVAISFSK